jgi:tRNA nucleotidyltransferase/poly(A) polymerase/predicted kinase
LFLDVTQKELKMKILKLAEQKILWVNRGLPGSGKSTLARELGKGGVVLGSDEFFMVNGEYRFDPDMRGHAHLWNQGRVRQAMQKGVSPIVVDNTNVTWAEIQPYSKLAKEHGYEIAYAEPQTPWKFDVDELTKRNVHKVPREVIQRMKDKWQPTETLGMDKTASAAVDPTGFSASGRLTPDEIELFSILMQVVKEKTPNTTVRAVGGWTRDKLLGKQPKDIDLMVDNVGGPEFAKIVTDFIGLSGPHTIKANPDQSKNLETSRMYIPLSSGAKLEIDVAKARQDVYQDKSRIPTIVPATAEEDATRRDLTVNCLFYNINRDLIEDFTGKGISDLNNHIIRTPLDPAKTYSDDPLRMMRTIRFAARYGWDIDPETRKALGSPELRKKLQTKVSRERKGIELKDMLSTGFPEVAVDLLFDTGIFEDILNDVITGTARSGRMSNILMNQNNPHHDLNWAEHTKALARGVARKYRGQDKNKVFTMMMSAMLHDVGKLDSASQQQKAPNHTTYHGHEDVSKEITVDFMKFVKLEPFTKPVEVLVGNHMRPHELASAKNRKALRRFIRNMAEAGVEWEDVVNLSQADALAKGGKPEEGTEEKYSNLLNEGKDAMSEMTVSKGSGVKPIVNGKEIMDTFGLKQGPVVGEMLKAVNDMMDENPTISKDEAIAKLRSLFPQVEKNASTRNWLEEGLVNEIRS